MPDPQKSGAAQAGGANDLPIDRSLPYPSCDWLESGLAFNRRSLHACLIVHHGRGFPKLCDFNGGEVPWEEVSRARREIIRQNQQGGHPACAGCPNLTTKLWREPDYDLKLVGIAQFVRCNIFCNYCFLQTQDPESFKDGLDPYKVEPAIDALIRDGRLAPDVVFDWGGGEPTVYKEFDSILTKVTEFGGKTWVHTNATRFPKPLTDGLPAAPVGIICSVDAGFPETYAEMKGRDYLERVWANLAKFIDAGCPVHLKYIVKDENCSPDELQAFVGRAAEIGAPSLIVDLDSNFPNPSGDVLNGVVMLKTLARLYGIQTSFGATGAQVLPEFDEGRRAWDGVDAPGQALPVQKKVGSPLGEITVRSGLTGEGLQAEFLGSLAATETAEGRYIVRSSSPGDTVTVSAFAHEPQDLLLGAGDAEVLLTPIEVDPDSVFSRLTGFSFAEVPGVAEPGLGRLEDLLQLDGVEGGAPSTAARFLIHQSLVATLVVISMAPGLGTSGRLQQLATSFAEVTGCELEARAVEGERLYTGHPSDRLTWIAWARHSVIFIVLSVDAAFADGVARSVLKQIR